MKHLSVLLLALVAMYPACVLRAQSDTPSEAVRDTSIPYRSVEEALKDLHANPAVKFRTEDGWIVAEDTKAMVVWLITPVGHPAYPSVIKRLIVNGAKGANMETNIRCFASQEACDKFFAGK